MTTFLCIEIGTTQNPCRCKIIGPTIALILALLLIVLCWPLGAILYLVCARRTASNLFATPANTYLATKGAIPF